MALINNLTQIGQCSLPGPRKELTSGYQIEKIIDFTIINGYRTNIYPY